MSKTTITGIAIFFLATAAFTWAYFNVQKTQDKLATKVSPTPKPNNSDKDKLVPIHPSNASVSQAYIVYVFKTTLMAINGSNDYIQIVSDLKSAQKFQFVLSKDTKIYTKRGNNKKNIASVSDLKPHQKIEMSATYGLKSKKWKLTSITIFIPDQSSTPSAKKST